MRNLILLVLTCLLAFGALAQPTITKLMNLDIGDKYTVKEGGTDITLAMITEGPNQNWDFRNLPPDLDPTTAICIDPASTPFADSLQVKNSNLAIKPYGNETDTMQIYQYMRVGNDKCESMALGIYDQINKTNVSYSKWLDPAVTLKYPFTYGDSYNDRQILWLNHIIQNACILKDTSDIQISAVGYGTIKTPAGTFQNALLVKETVDWVWWNNYDDFQFKTQGTDINYNWFVPGIKIAVFSVNMVDETSGIVSYISATDFNTGGIDNPDDDENGTGNGGGTGGNGDDEPYDPCGVWLNTMACGGNCYFKSNGSLNWTLGESVINTIDASSNICTQGFGQPQELATSVKENLQNSDISVYPNPFVSEITIDFPSFEKSFDAAIYSTTGQIMEIFSVVGPRTQLHLNNYKSGIYYIRMRIEDGPCSFVVLKK